MPTTQYLQITITHNDVVRVMQVKTAKISTTSVNQPSPK